MGVVSVLEEVVEVVVAGLLAFACGSVCAGSGAVLPCVPLEIVVSRVVLVYVEGVAEALGLLPALDGIVVEVAVLGEVVAVVVAGLLAFACGSVCAGLGAVLPCVPLEIVVSRVVSVCVEGVAEALGLLPVLVGVVVVVWVVLDVVVVELWWAVMARVVVVVVVGSLAAVAIAVVGWVVVVIVVAWLW